MTAVEFLEQELDKNFEIRGNSFLFDKILKQSKEMEKGQHQETWETAHQAGRFEGKCIAEDDWQTFEAYWVETFKSEQL